MVSVYKRFKHWLHRFNQSSNAKTCRAFFISYSFRIKYINLPHIYPQRNVPLIIAPLPIRTHEGNSLEMEHKSSSNRWSAAPKINGCDFILQSTAENSLPQLRKVSKREILQQYPYWSWVKNATNMDSTSKECFDVVDGCGYLR